MDINDRPDIVCDKGLIKFVLSCIEYVFYEGLIDRKTYDLFTHAFFNRLQDEFDFEMFIQEIHTKVSLELERRKLWL